MRVAIANIASVRRRYPRAYDEALAELRGGRSRDRNVPEDQLTWHFEWCSAVGLRLDPNVAVVDQGWLRIRGRECRVLLTCSCRRARGYSTPLRTPPVEVDTYYADLDAGVEAERARIASLTPEERQRELDEILAELRKDPGFIEVAF